MWRLLSGVIAGQILGHYTTSCYQKNKKNARKDLEELTIYYYIDRAVIREVKSRKKSLAMAWMDYKKAYDMVPHSSIKECLDLFGVAENIKTLLVNSMEK